MYKKIKNFNIGINVLLILLCLSSFNYFPKFIESKEIDLNNKISVIVNIESQNYKKDSNNFANSVQENQIITEKGSYLLFDGAIVLVEEDVNDYLQGTLTFNENYKCC